MEKLTLTIDKLFQFQKEKLKDREEIKKIDIINQYDKDNHGKVYRYTKYLEILLKETFLNDRDTDLIDIEISYGMYNKESLEVKGEFYASDGTIFEEILLVNNEASILNDIEIFINNCGMQYDEVIKEYIN